MNSSAARPHVLQAENPRSKLGLSVGRMVKPETERYDCSIQTEAATEELLPMVAVLFPLVVRLISKTPDLEHAPKLQADSPALNPNPNKTRLTGNDWRDPF